jgi:hypothetical protein
MQKHGKYTRNWNEVKGIIIPNSYSNDWGGAGEKEEPTLAETARMGPPSTSIISLLSVFRSFPVDGLQRG